MGGRSNTERLAPITWDTARCNPTSTGWALVIPTPERTNAIWRQWQGRTLVSARHRRDKLAAPRQFAGLPCLSGDLFVRMVWVRERKSGDVDSRIKATLDLLTAMGIWADDKQVQRLSVERVDDPQQAPGMYVWIEPAMRRAA